MRKALLVAAALALGGCHPGQSADDRINAALPPGTEIIAARSALDALIKPQSPDARALDIDYSARLKARALECGHGYRPSAFASVEAIRDALVDKDCFAKSDRNLLEWLAGRRIGLLLSAPPLRPVPATAPDLLIASGPVGEVSFAERAGIALVTSGKHFQAIDMGTGATISAGDSDYLPARNLSPNGRLFVLPREGARIEVRDTQTGAVLATFDQLENNAFNWVGDAGAIFKRRGAIFGDDNPSAYPVFLDFATGKQTPIPITAGAVGEVLALPGPPHRFAVLAGNRLAVIELRQAAQGWDAVMLSERALPSPSWWTSAGSGLTADGRVFFRTGKSLELLTLATLELKTVTFDPMGVQSAVATTDPDVLLLNARFTTALGGGSFEPCLYSLSQRTLAKVNTTQLLSPRILYIPSLRKNAVIDDSKIAMIDSIPAAAPIAINDYIDQRMQAVAALQSGGQAAPIAAGAGANAATRVPVNLPWSSKAATTHPK